MISPIYFMAMPFHNFALFILSQSKGVVRMLSLQIQQEPIYLHTTTLNQGVQGFSFYPRFTHNEQNTETEMQPFFSPRTFVTLNL